MKTQNPRLRFQIEKGVFLLGIQRAQGVTEKRSTASIFSNVLLEGTTQGSGSKGQGEFKGQISIVATDLEIGIKGTYPARVHSEGGIAVSGKKLHEIIRELPEGEVDISVEDGKFLMIKSGNSFFKVAGSNKEDFPAFPEMSEENMVTIDSSIYREMIKKTLFAVADAEARQALNGALLEIEQEGDKRARIRMVATDGHRMALCERWVEISQTAKQIILPKKTLLELRKFLEVNEGIKTGLGEKQISFKGEDVYLTSRLIEGNYPNYKQVIPPKGEQIVRINRTHFMDVVRRVSVMSREKTRAILVEFSAGKAIFRARDPEIGEASEDIAIDYKGPGLTIGLNYQYLLDALESMEDEEVMMEMQTSLSPCVLKQESDPNSLSIVMPMRVQEME